MCEAYGYKYYFESRATLLLGFPPPSPPQKKTPLQKVAQFI